MAYNIWHFGAINKQEDSGVLQSTQAKTEFSYWQPSGPKLKKFGWHWSHFSPITPGLQRHLPLVSH